MTDWNDCQNAWSILAMGDGATETGEGETHRIEIRAKLAAAGELSDGTRVAYVKHCDRWRYLIVTLGWDQIAEIDQRAYFQRPNDLAIAVLDAIAAQSSVGDPWGRKAKTADKLPSALSAPAQSLIPGLAPVSPAERLQARQRGRKQATCAQQPPNHGLFDLGARVQADFISES